MEEIDTFQAIVGDAYVRVVYFQDRECTWLLGQRASKDVPVESNTGNWVNLDCRGMGGVRNWDSVGKGLLGYENDGKN